MSICNKECVDGQYARDDHDVVVMVMRLFLELQRIQPGIRSAKCEEF